MLLYSLLVASVAVTVWEITMRLSSASWNNRTYRHDAIVRLRATGVPADDLPHVVSWVIRDGVTTVYCDYEVVDVYDQPRSQQ